MPAVPNDQVKLRVTFHRARGPQNAIAEKHEVVVTLKTPLGNRKVLNGAGAEVQKCGPGVGCAHP
jgi:hypothetical protein